MEICTTGNYLLVGKTKLAVRERCLEVWEEIVQRNAEVSGNYTYMNHFRALKEYYRLINEHALVKAVLQKYSFSKNIFKRGVGPVTQRDKELVAMLAKKGYPLNFKDDEKFADSLLAAMRKSQNLLTKITMKRNELNGFLEAKGQQQSFEEVMADLISALQFNVDDNITLARYNEYKKFIKVKYKRREKGVLAKQ